MTPRFNARPYQIDCHAAVLRSWGIAPWYQEGDVFNSTLAVISTGGGKTLVAAMLVDTIVRTLGKRVLFLGDSTELVHQPLEKIAKATGIYPSLEKADQKASLEAECVVASTQTLSKKARLSRFAPDHFDFIIADEAHRYTEMDAKIIRYFEKAKVCGFTATAFRRTAKDLKKWYKSVAYTLDWKGEGGLVDQGYLTPVTHLTLDIEADISKVEKDKATGDLDADQLDCVLAPLYRAVARQIRDNPHLQKRRILAFLPLIRSSKAFVQICQEEGVSARHSDGTDKNRDMIVASFERGDFQVLSNSQCYSVGVDFLRCDTLLNLCPTGSPGLYRQRLGRILRTLPGVVDHLATAEERKAAIAASEKPNAMICDLLLQFGDIALADPASLITDNEEEQQLIREKLDKQRTPEQLEAVARAVQAEREKKVLDEWQQKAKGKKSELVSAQVWAAMHHAQSVREYEPYTDNEAAKPTPAMRRALQIRGIDPKSVKSKGLAGLLIGKVDNTAPPHAWDALRERGIERPERLSLDDAIKTLRTDFPCGFGVHAGKPFRQVPYSFWKWCYDQYYTFKTHHMRKLLERYPAEKRYMKKLVEQQQLREEARRAPHLNLV